MFDNALFSRLLKTRRLGRVSRHFDTLGSTNDFLLKTPSAPFGMAVTAERQTAGRGRLGRRWQTSPGSALAMSVLCGPFEAGPDGYRRAAMLPFCCAVAAARALEALCEPQHSALQNGGPIPFAIKWPNDILGAGPDGGWYKICGILCETARRDGQLAAVCGFGVNLSQGEAFFRRAGLPNAASLRSLGFRAAGREETAAALLEELEPLLGRLQNSPPRLPSEYAPLCLTLGKPIRFLRDGVEREGSAAGLAPDGALLVDTARGRDALYAGDVRVRGARGLI